MLTGVFVSGDRKGLITEARKKSDFYRRERRERRSWTEEFWNLGLEARFTLLTPVESKQGGGVLEMSDTKVGEGQGG